VAGTCAGSTAQHPRWGARKLAWKLEQEHGTEITPSSSTIGRLLHEMGLSARKPSWRAKGSGPLGPAEQPNEVWAIDFKGWCRTGDGKRCEPLTVTDHASRYLLCCQALESIRTELARPVLERTFRQYGLPHRMRSDNGPPFGSNGACGLTALSVWWIELGLVCERIQPGHPQQNGRHERMHRTLQEETMQSPAASLRKQQARFDAFQREYNEQRPHEALGQVAPATVYTPAARSYPQRITQPEYPRGWQVRKVCNGGQVGWAGVRRRWFLSHALTGKYVGLEPLSDEQHWRVWFYNQWLGLWDARRWRLWRPGQRQTQAATPVLSSAVSQTGA